MSSSNCCFLTCIRISQEADQVVWYSHLFQNFPQFVAIHTVRGFGIDNKAKLDVFLEHGNILSQSSGDSKSQMQVSSEWVLSESGWEGSALCLSLSFWCLLVILGVPWLVETSLSSSSVFTWSLLCVFFSLYLFSSYNDTSHIGLRVTLLLYGLPWWLRW